MDGYLAREPDLFEREVNPFALEYLFHKELHEAGASEVFDNLQTLLRIVPGIRVDDMRSIVSVVSINNSDATLREFESLDPGLKSEFFGQLIALQKDLHESGGLRKASQVARSEWIPYMELISNGSLGHQNDGYHRAASLLRAHILLLTFLTVREGGTHTLESLHAPFQSNIEEDVFSKLLEFEPQIQRVAGLFRFMPNVGEMPEVEPEEDVGGQIEKIRYETRELTDVERSADIRRRLRLAEASPVVTVPRGEGRSVTSSVRHRRDANTSALMRLYFKDVCQHCGFDGNSEYGAGIAEVDHAIDEIAVTQNNRPSNLIVLCRNCHGAKTKGFITITDHGDHFIAKNNFTGREKRIDKPDLS